MVCAHRHRARRTGEVNLQHGLYRTLPVLVCACIASAQLFHICSVRDQMQLQMPVEPNAQRPVPQAAAREGFHAAVLSRAEAQPGSGGARSSFLDHQGSLLRHLCRLVQLHTGAHACEVAAAPAKPASR